MGWKWVKSAPNISMLKILYALAGAIPRIHLPQHLLQPRTKARVQAWIWESLWVKGQSLGSRFFCSLLWTTWHDMQTKAPSNASKEIVIGRDICLLHDCMDILDGSKLKWNSCENHALHFHYCISESPFSKDHIILIWELSPGINQY